MLILQHAGSTVLKWPKPERPLVPLPLLIRILAHFVLKISHSNLSDVFQLFQTDYNGKLSIAITINQLASDSLVWHQYFSDLFTRNSDRRRVVVVIPVPSAFMCTGFVVTVLIICPNVSTLSFLHWQGFDSVVSSSVFQSDQRLSAWFYARDDCCASLSTLCVVTSLATAASGRGRKKKSYGKYPARLSRI